MSRSHNNLDGTSFTLYGWLLCSWVLITCFQYGYHISALNQIQAVLTCKNTHRNVESPTFYEHIPTCIPMSDFTFSLVTAVFTVGGLMGSLVANLVMNRWGRKGASRASSLLLAGGAVLMTISPSVGLLSFGRWLTGVASGIGLCVAPLYLAEIAPKKISGSVGVLTQLAIVFGIMITQCLGIRFATPTEWRTVLASSAALSFVQFFTSHFALESPAWLGDKGMAAEKQAVISKIWNSGTARLAIDPESVNEPLFDTAEQDRGHEEHAATVSVRQLLSAPELRRPLLVVSLAMSSQQLSGINAVLYYSNEILSKSLPEFGPYVSLGVTVVNVLMTFPPIILIERMGRRKLLLLSVGGSLLSLLSVGYGMDSGWRSLQSIAIISFVMSFAVGLGPVPFVMISEVSPFHAVSALSTVALSLNWTVNFFVGLAFLPLRNWLSSGDPLREGRVFYVFASILLAGTASLFKLYRG